MLKVVVSRATWLRGEGSEDSYLLRPSDRKKCCLGFACLAAGLTEAAISGIDTPIALETERKISLPLPLQTLVDSRRPEQSTSVCVSLMRANDATEGFTAKERERYIRSKGRQAGLDFEFVD